MQNITELSPGVWKLAVSLDPDELQRYRKDIGCADALVGIKVKHGGQAFYLRGGKELVFDSVRWLGHSRGVVFDTESVTLRDTRVDRDPDRVNVEALATNGGDEDAEHELQVRGLQVQRRARRDAGTVDECRRRAGGGRGVC